MFRRSFMFASVCVCLLSGVMRAAPEPAVASSTWQLDFAFDDPKRISVLHPGAAEPTNYWYVIYTVTNHTGRDVEFYPNYYIVTDGLKVIEGGYGVSPAVFDAIRTRHAKAFPFSLDPMKVFGTLQQGEDNARTSIIVFPEFETDVNGFTVFVGGLSGEIARVRNHGFDRSAGESAGTPAFFYLRKTLAITYDLPGDGRTRLQAAAVRVKQEWVMR